MGFFNFNKEDSPSEETKNTTITSDDGYDPKILDTIMNTIVNSSSYNAELTKLDSYHKVAIEHPEVVSILENLHEAEKKRYTHLLYKAHAHILAAEKRYNQELQKKEAELLKANAGSPRLKIIITGLLSILGFFLLGIIVLFILGRIDPTGFDKAIQGMEVLNKTLNIAKDKIL